MKKRNSIIIAMLMPIVALFLIAPRVTRHKEMDKDEIKYLKRTGTAWSKTGRIVGELKNPPDQLTIEFYSISEGKIVCTYKAPGKLFIYASKYLPPGTYNVTFKAPEYADFEVKKVKVVKEADCMLNITFGTRVFSNS